MKEELKEKLQQYFDEKIPAMSEETKQMLRMQVAENKQRNENKIVFWKRFAVAMCCMLLLIPCIVLPIVLRPLDESFYGEDEVTETHITIEQAQSYIDENFQQYSFIFDDCDFSLDLYGFYENQNNKLVALRLHMKKKAIPKTQIEFNLIVNNRYKFADEDIYKNQAEKIEKDNYTLYKLTYGELSLKYLRLLEYSNFKLFLEFNIDDQEFFEKFL